MKYGLMESEQYIRDKIAKELRWVHTRILQERLYARDPKQGATMQREHKELATSYQFYAEGIRVVVDEILFPRKKRR